LLSRFPFSLSLFLHKFRSLRSSLSVLCGTCCSLPRYWRVTVGLAMLVLILSGVLGGVLAGSASPAGKASRLGAVAHSGAAHSAAKTDAAGAAPRAAAGNARAGDASAGRPAAHAVAASQHAAASHPQASPSHPAPAARPYLIYDSVTPAAIPTNQKVATYSNGRYAVTPSQVARRGPVLWIDVNATDPYASVLDVEPGDATPAAAANWTYHKLKAQPHALARIYTMRSEWAAVRAAVGELPSPMRSQVRWWIADPTGVPHIVPGADATQWYWGTHYDITTARPGF
jgi:hypothetical protein